MREILLAVFAVVCFSPAAAGQSNYAGEETRAIKSLSSSQIESLRRGDGMGFAKLAELNHYPGPKHVLEIAEQLGLNPSKIAETTKLYEEMRSNAIAIGEELIEAESRLDHAFESGSVTPTALATALLEVGELRARLRYVHLEAHLRQKALLSPEQVKKYDALRGYTGAGHDYSRHRE